MPPILSAGSLATTIPEKMAIRQRSQYQEKVENQPGDKVIGKFSPAHELKKDSFQTASLGAQQSAPTVGEVYRNKLTQQDLEEKSLITSSEVLEFVDTEIDERLPKIWLASRMIVDEALDQNTTPSSDPLTNIQGGIDSNAQKSEQMNQYFRVAQLPENQTVGLNIDRKA